MSIPCRSGLFIGIERHAGLPKAESLPGAPIDAFALRDYFSASLPEGQWRVLPAKLRGSPPRRSEIISLVSAFAKEVAPSTAGLIFFSGHASSTPKGLVLKPADAVETVLGDTGLSLALVLEILQRHARDRRRFVVILDCCRDGLTDASTDAIPSNVCVLYACGHGEVTWDTTKGGILTRSVIESLSSIASDTGTKQCSVRILSNRLGRQLFGWRAAQMLQHELCGTGAETIQLPIRQGDVEFPRRQQPDAWLSYGFGTREGFERGAQVLSAALFNWYGIPYQSHAGQAFIKEHFRFPQLEADVDRRPSDKDGGRSISPSAMLGFEIHLPAGGNRWTTADFLTHMLDVPVDLPEKLIMSWSRQVEFVELKPLEHVVRGEWSRVGPEGEYRLQWKNAFGGSEYRGVAVVSTESTGMRLYVGCETADCFEMPLQNLMPALPSIFDLFRSVVA